MTFIETVSETEAAGATAEIYRFDRDRFGELPNFTKAFSLRPNVYTAWLALNDAVKSNMDLRRYELATMAAALRLRSSYCALAHGSVLMSQFLEPPALQAVIEDVRTAGLEPADVAVMELADKVAHDATAVTEDDIDRLRDLGLSDAEILDVVLAAAVRCFFSKTLDGLGVTPDAKYLQLGPEIRDALTVGRPITATTG